MPRTVFTAHELLQPKVLEAAAREIEPHLNCWHPRVGPAQDWRKGEEIKHAERIIRAAIAAAKEE